MPIADRTRSKNEIETTTIHHDGTRQAFFRSIQKAIGPMKNKETGVPLLAFPPHEMSAF